MNVEPPKRQPALDVPCAFLCPQVCIPDASFNDATATNICRLMGRPTPGRAVQGSYWGAGNGLVWLDRLWCPYYPAASFLDCVGRNWGMPDSRCTPGMMAGIVCGAEPSEWIAACGLRAAEHPRVSF